MICYGVSSPYSKTISNVAGMAKLVHGIVECPSLSDVYLLRFTKRDAIKIKALHKQVHGISG